MAQQYVSINRGKTGTKFSDFTKGTASTAGDDIEIRFNDAVGITRKDLTLALEAFELFYQNYPLTTTTPPL